MYCKTGERFMKARTIYNKNGNQNKKEAAAGAGVTESILSNIENDDIDRDVGCSHVIALAKYYGVTTDYLLGLSNAPTNDESVISAVSYTGLSVETVNKLKGITKAPSRKYFLEALINDDTLLGCLVNYAFSYIPYEVHKSKYGSMPLKYPLRRGFQDSAFASVIRNMPLFAERVESEYRNSFDELAIEYLRKNADIDAAKKEIARHFDYFEYMSCSFDDEIPDDYDSEHFEIYYEEEEMMEIEEAEKKYEESMDNMIEVLDKLLKKDK